MRRPTFCNNSVAVEPPIPSDKEEGRLTKVKRMFSNSLRKSVVNKVFAVHLDDLPVNKDHVPKVLNKMANYIETYGLHVEGLFRLSGGNPALVEQLKASFNRSGDADLEACSDVASVASLLKVWLRDLPEPLITPATTAELVTLLHKYRGEAEWCGQAKTTLAEVPPRNAATLQRVLSLLHMYSVKQPASAPILPPVFSPLLLCAEFHGISTPETTHVVARLIHDYPAIYHNKVAEGNVCQMKQRKRKERHNSDAASLDRKFVRSNSEERPCVEERALSQSDSIRRVSSHEDFRSRKHFDHQQSQKEYEPLHERTNWPAGAHSRASHSHKHRASERQTCHNGLSELIQSSPSPGYASDLFEENEHEVRRRSERHAPRPVPRTRRRKSQGKLPRHWNSSDDNEGSSSKENEEEQPVLQPAPQPSLSEEESPLCRSTSSSSSHSFLQLHPQEKERSPSPVPPPSTPPLDLSTLHQQVDSSEPLTSRSFRHPQDDDRLISPRNSIVMTRRVYSNDDSPQAEGQASQMNKQIHSLKRKLKRYEEGFEKQFGYRPSHADKMSNPETKKMCSLLTKLRKEVKSMKEDGTYLVGKVGLSGEIRDNKPTETLANKEEAIHDVEKKLSEKRTSSGRPENVDVMSREQLVEEKLAVQKGLLYLENTFGRPTNRDDRDLVRPLYDRYRLLKRLLARNAPSKLKDNVTELGTILEHETMDFTSSSPPPPVTSPSPPCTSVAAPPSPPRSNTPDLENIHAMPLSELLAQQQATREEKKRLRRTLREFEEECQKTMGRKLSKEDRLPMEQTYTEYKHAKAKLRLLEALLMKKK